MPLLRLDSVPRLPHLLAAGNIDRLPGHVASLIRREEHHHIRHILIGAAPAQRHLIEIPLPHLFLGDAQPLGVLVIEDIHPEGRVQQVARADGIDPHIVGREVQRDALRQADEFL